jgi:hypothetical protein
MRLMSSAVLVCTLAGCMTIGTKFDIKRVDELKPGSSSIAEAKALLGPPTSASTKADGATLLQWQYVQGTAFGGSGAHAAILFDPAGVMVRVTHRFETK